GLKSAKTLEKDSKGVLAQGIINIYAEQGGAEQWPYVYTNFKELGAQSKFELLPKFSTMVSRLEKSEDARQGIEEIKTVGVRYKSFGVGPFISTMLTNIKEQRTKLNDEASVKAVEQAIAEVNAK
ncbi:MAG: hypothetical protein H7Z72_23540, partial [Bacteroidetes bacterium]|nr:hypothetical protein [Fibrella sp.]